jgi:electron transfer flavoprotein alpha subunit
MRGADCIVSIDKNPQALIFNVADYAIVADIGEILPLIIEKVKATKEK